MNVHIMPNTKTQPDKTELDRFHAWLATEDPISIATHVHVDADAAFSAVLACSSRRQPSFSCLLTQLSRINDPGRRPSQWTTCRQGPEGRQCLRPARSRPQGH